MQLVLQELFSQLDSQFTECYMLTLLGDSGIISGNAELARIMGITG